MNASRPLFGAGVAVAATMLLLAASLTPATSSAVAPRAPGHSTSEASDSSVAAQSGIDQEFPDAENLGPLIRSVAAFDSAYGVENGHDVMYTTVTGRPATFQVVDLDSHELIRSIPLDGAGDSWSHAVADNGEVIISGGGKLFRYSPTTATVDDLGQAPGAKVLYGVSPDEHGNIYAGTYPDGKVVKFDAATEQYVDYGSMVPDQDYVRGLALHDGTVYAGVGITGSLWAVDAATGAKSEIPLPDRAEYDLSSPPNIYSLNTAGNLLFVFLSGVNLLLAYDMEAGSWSDTAVTNYRGLYTSPELDGKVYLISGGKLRSFDLATHEIADTGLAFGTYLRHAGWVDVSATNPDLPGLSLVTVQYGGAITFMNLTSGTVLSKPSILEGQPVPIQTLERGPDNRLYASGYPGGTGARFDPATDSLVSFPLGQSEGMTSLGDSIYFGNYPGAVIHELDTTQPIKAGSNPRQVHDIGNGQDRPFAMTSGDGKLFVGTIPTYGELGGALTVKDGDSWTTHRNIVEGQSVMSLAYRDGKVYGSTTVWGGLGIEPTQDEARIFVYDVASGVKEAEFTPDLPGEITPKSIGSLAFGPDGLLWGAAWGTVFALDPDTYEVVKSREIFATDWDFGHLWRPMQLRWAADGLLYTTLGQHVTVVDPETLDHRVLDDSALMTLGANGDIYYVDGENLMRVRDVAAPAAPTITEPTRPGPSEDSTPDIAVTTEPGALVQVWHGDVEVGRSTAGDDGTATVEAGPLDRGRYQLTVTATDAAGNISDATPVPLIVVR